MKATRVKIHNFRSILDADLEMAEYGLLVGPNGAGKSNALAAIRVFYDEIKFIPSRDFPKMTTPDKESWVEIQYEPTPEEASGLKEEYLDGGTGTFTVRRYFETEEKGDDGKSMAGGLFAYVNGELSRTRFYGAKNVQQAKLGKVVYIPAVTKLDDHTKLSGPSSLRELVNYVLKGQLENSPQFEALTEAFRDFRSTLRGASGGPLMGLEQEITSEISDWGHEFRLDVRALGVDELLKGLVSPKIIDGDLEQELDPSQFGHGFQRHLVYCLMMLAARHGNLSKKKPTKKDFDPDLFWVLYEEPEAFLHPPQAEVLNIGLRQFSEATGHQVTITTHSPIFASKNLGAISALVRLSRTEMATRVGQVKRDEVASLIEDNQEVLENLEHAGVSLTDVDKIEMEALKYALWLSPLRSSALFAERVLLVEGTSERVLVGYLLDRGELKVPSGGVSVIDTMGKFNLHRFMNLLGALNVRHAVLYDKDDRPGQKEPHRKRNAVFNQAIQDASNPCTVGIQSLEEDLENALGIEKPKGLRNDQKPQFLMHKVVTGEVAREKLTAFAALVQGLISDA